MKKNALALCALAALSLPATAQQKAIIVDVHARPIPALSFTYDSRFTPNSRWGYRTGLSISHWSATDNDPVYRPYTPKEAMGLPSTLQENYHYTATMTGVSIPVEVNYLVGRGPFYFECALGLTGGHFWKKEDGTLDIGAQSFPIHDTDHRWSFSVYANLGVRYQPTKGLLLRTGVTPEMMPTETRSLPSSGMDVLFPFLPSAYLSVGYSF